MNDPNKCARCGADLTAEELVLCKDIPDCPFLASFERAKNRAVAINAAALALMDELYDGRASLPRDHPAWLPIYECCYTRAKVALDAAARAFQQAAPSEENKG